MNKIRANTPTSREPQVAAMASVGFIEKARAHALMATGPNCGTRSEQTRIRVFEISRSKRCSLLDWSPSSCLGCRTLTAISAIGGRCAARGMSMTHNPCSIASSGKVETRAA